MASAVIFDEIELTDACLFECSTKNVNHSFQVITPFRSLVLCAESRREMEDWMGALTAVAERRYHHDVTNNGNTAGSAAAMDQPDQPDCLSGYHHWYATSHARPTYCNVCREALGGVTSHGLSCEVCKCKVHKRCAAKAINNCKWTTLSSVGKDILEEADGSITMPHQWMEGNLPVSAKCAVCDKTCGSVLRLQDWRCLWCRATVHTQCRPTLPPACPLGPARVSVVPPTALHSIQDEAWEAVRPQASSPLLVFVNSKSGDNQGVKFLRRFKQLLNPAQVFDLISTGPRLGLRLFRHFDPFRILVCSGDGSVGWVLSEIDKLDMHKQCQIAVLPLGTGNDLARVLGWGSSCDDDTHLPQLLEKYEKAGTKMLDRWSIMAFERHIAMPKLSLTPGQPDGQLHSQISQYEDSLVTHLQNILQSDETTVILNSAKRLCETVKDFAAQLSESSLTRGDEELVKKSDVLQQKLDLLLSTLTSEQMDMAGGFSDRKAEDTDSEMSFDKVKSEKSDKSEKDLSNITNINFRKHRRTSRFMEREKGALLLRANSLKRAIRNLVEHTEQLVDEQNRQSTSSIPTVKISLSTDLDKEDGGSNNRMDSLKVLSTIESGSNSDVSSCPSPTSSILTARLANISPMPDVRRDSTVEDPDFLSSLPVPPDFADSSRRSSQVQPSSTVDVTTEKILLETCSTLITIGRLHQKQPQLQQPPPPQTHEQPVAKTLETILGVKSSSTSSDQQQSAATAEQSLVQQEKLHQEQQRRDSNISTTKHDEKNLDQDEKECSSILSATISNEEVSITSEILDQKSFVPRKNSDGEDLNGHIYHIDSPETDTYPNSDALHGESLMDDISSMLGEVLCGYDQDSIENTSTDDTTLFASDMAEIKLERRMSSKRNSIERGGSTGHKPQRRSSNRSGKLATTTAAAAPQSIADDDTQFGFENRAFMSQHVYLNNNNKIESTGDTPATASTAPKYCSLAQFVEGNDIARRSFKKRPTTVAPSAGAGGAGAGGITTKMTKTESNLTKQDTLLEESEVTPMGSHTNLSKLEKELSNVSTSTLKAMGLVTPKEESTASSGPANEKTDQSQQHQQQPNVVETCIFPQVSVIVEPPSPVMTEEIRKERRAGRLGPDYVIDPTTTTTTTTSTTTTGSDFDLRIFGTCSSSKLSTSGDVTNNTNTPSQNSSNSNLLGIVDNDSCFLTRSPAATRRISCCSMLNPAEAAAIAAAATSSFHSELEKKDREKSKEERDKDNSRKLPIINPLVRLPTWPHVSTGTGFISKCLLANADTLCAAVSPLIDPDETLMEGFYERCVMNNYFGIGIDAKISLDFHHKREEHPEKCRSRAKNYMWYGVLGSKQWLQKTYKNLEQRVQLECDGQRIPLPSLQGIVILNIPSFMGGINFWGGTKEDSVFLPPSFDDKILEVVAVFGSVQMAASRLINLQHHRIAQCQSIQINILGDEGVPIQVDGEAWVQPPGIIRILHKNRMQMLCRNRALENSLKSWEEKQRQSIAAQGSKPRHSLVPHDKGRQSLTRQSMPSSHQEKSFLGVNFEKIRQHSFSGAVPVHHQTTPSHHPERPSTVTFLEKPLERPGRPRGERSEPDLQFSSDEHRLLINFIECATTLIKWIKILAISYQLESDLYTLATKAERCLENIHPNGKILEGPGLRREFTKLVQAVKLLYEESCCLLHDRGDKLKLREDLENKLSVSLANMEMELRKCVMYDAGGAAAMTTTTGGGAGECSGLVYLQPLPDDQSEHKRKGLFWLKFRTHKGPSGGQQHSGGARGGKSGGRRGESVAASWGTQEVATWLETLQLSEYIDSFVKNDIRGRELLTLARRDLKDLGVTKVGHVKRILQAIKDLTQGL